MNDHDTSTALSNRQVIAISPSTSSAAVSDASAAADESENMTSTAPSGNDSHAPKPAKEEKLDDRSRSGHNPRQPVAEFLYQVTKMLQDDNDEIVEWTNARIKVHSPERLENEVLHKYFRHSKFASFQRQLNYFGFRKIAGKGKMSPCSYVNDAVTDDIGSLLKIKRKTNGSAARKAAMGGRSGRAPGHKGSGAGLKHQQPQSTSAGSAASAVTPNTSAIFSEKILQNAIRAGLSQQQIQQKVLGESLYFPSDAALAALAAGHSRQSVGELSRLNLQQLSGRASGTSGMPSLSGQLAGITGLQDPATAALNLASSMACPATAAMNAAAATSQNNNFFESTPNLNSLVNEHAGASARSAALSGAAAAAAAAAGRLPSQNLLNRLPSTNTLFPENLSSVSLNQFLGSSNRISSLLSLSNFLNRDPSMLDLVPAGVPLGSQFPAVAGGSAAEPSSPFQDPNRRARPGTGSMQYVPSDENTF